MGRHNLSHRRRSIRLRGYDYTQPGAYFVTICTHERKALFGQVVDGDMVLNEWGWVVGEEWFKTAQIRPYVELFEDEFVVMPNHIHGILWIVDDGVGARRRRAPTVEQFGKPVPKSIPTIIRAFKSAVTRRINQMHGTPGARVWQRNYYKTHHPQHGKGARPCTLTRHPPLHHRQPLALASGPLQPRRHRPRSSDSRLVAHVASRRASPYP